LIKTPLPVADKRAATGTRLRSINVKGEQKCGVSMVADGGTTG
jgi:hypothetical protein